MATVGQRKPSVDRGCDWKCRREEELSFSCPDNISLNWSPNESENQRTRYVRIELPGKGKNDPLAELQRSLVSTAE